MKELNINSTVRVKLTDVGINILKQKYEEMVFNNPSLAKTINIKFEDNGYISIQLWLLMQIFGSFMYTNNTKLPIDTNILISDEYLIDKNQVKTL